MEKARVPHGSPNVSHVPPPDPAYFWPFTEGQTRSVAVFRNAAASLRLDKLGDGWADFTMILTPGREIPDNLWLDRPVVMLKNPAGEPMITVTLRAIEGGKAYLQMTGNGRGTLVKRQ